MTNERKFKCKICMKAYYMEWARDNHEKLCREREQSKFKAKKE